MPILAKIMDKLFFSLESVSGYHLPFFLIRKRGELTELGVIAGHKGERPREEIFKIFTAFLDCLGPCN